VVARQAASRVGKQGHVVGVDLNAGMLGMARMLPQPPGVSIEWKEGNVTALPFPEASSDAVLCQQGLSSYRTNRQRYATSAVSWCPPATSS